MLHLMGVGVFLCLVGLFLQRAHVMMVLLSLEAMNLGLLGMVLCSMSGFVGLDGLMCLVAITMVVCEGSLGLSVLVSMVRAYGNEYVAGLSLQNF